ncbi:MAG: hypothetical protein UR85_C0006G0003 [Candidatus Nomurabacteria bacterium GW2011_GWF2_35_66]|uniref:Zinc-binding domain-containing protein n=1 Tax=Candidatus Nomurabacteria bacterium GW2011_GWE1_35_16 TaxID=1618761 RepID=A0A0G0BRR8_9BACT|nr:MAG: hypothetical protein UR55_C0010G0017 [Candidatus Nomurabacteria bacterium GW2011_GWF1_34_20]KKP63132.1 MAG: hypothetical protein UR57_C0008G0003 [Candidatus Nomurabacteria bacterium GW2011_GWE2_34_25]KKP66341.1 MAG: hypothetical protein UR64_C0009G0044 [Candidatus Nomurabacteria bacterium GW2011_GWE1_35_16]KKP83218.1 MAG: hypothetical protein UR85_C0006G0003 [Candidatus Nomurabacteria bacterium GW2011_GWF2_35_66]HAE36331.1 hypothetical protein [Candidatus Nomurabacteria bacterium]
MQSETKNCQNCKKDFTIESDDFLFYEKIKVPPPTWCPDCRQQRRYAWRNERTLYRRDCNLCGKSTVTIYSPNKDLKVYCLKCWWGDGWDPSSYGKDFDFSRPFFEQYKELQKIVPRMAVLSKNTINSEYTNHCRDNKNVYLTFTCTDSEDISYSTWIMKSRNCMDCSYIYEGGERLYECIDSRKVYHCQYGILLENCVDCYYCYDCHNCNDCFMSSNLRNKSFVFKNQQYSREAYLEKISEYNLNSYLNREKLYKEFLDFMVFNSIHRYVISERNVNSIGNMLFNSKNAINCFDSEVIEDVKNAYAVLVLKNSMDLYHIGWNTELAYEDHGCTKIYNCQFCHLCYDDSHLIYCDSCQNSQNLFGCISIKKGEYMILNKKYSKEEYLELKEKIIEHMKKIGEYGEFFPPSISPVCYNETQGNYYMPETKEEILSRGWLWEDKIPGIFGKETIQPEDIPDSIKDVDNSISKEILKCISCTKNYNIVPDELTFYRREEIPIPRNCPECRYKKRFNLRLPRKLWRRSCMKEGCNNEFETSYAPERLEIVYCEQCYQQEVY